MKKLSIALLIAAMFAFVACGSPTDSPANATEATTNVSAPEPCPFTDGATVSIVRSQAKQAKDIARSEVDSMVCEAVRLCGGLEGLVKNGQTVVLKPNLVQIKVDSTGDLLAQEVNGVTTDWRVTAAVAKLVRELNPDGKIYVMECSATGRTKDNMEYLRYTPESMPEVDAFFAFEEDSGDWHDYNSPKVLKVALKDGLLHKEYYFNKLFYEADVVISVPCLKTTSGVVVTAAIKNVSLGAPPSNIYGASLENPGSKMGMVSHKIVDGELDKWIYDYYMCRPIDFVVVDGLQGFQSGPVPMNGERRESDQMNMGLVLAGRDAIAVDTVCALTTGWDPESIGYLNHFRAHGVGSGIVQNILVAGENVADVRKQFTIKIPALGGNPVEEKKPPALEILDYSIDGGILRIDAKCSKDTAKLEVYIGGQFYALVSGGAMEQIEIETAGIKGTYPVRVVAFDRFLNYAAQEFEAAF